MHYYIDGYNLMFRILRAGDDLQAQRQRIIHDLNEKVQKLGLNVTIVFDAHYQYGESSRSHYNALEIMFTAQGETADEFILNELKASLNPREETVVTSDKELAWSARRRAAKTETVEQFMDWLTKRYRNKQSQIMPREEKPQTLPKKAPKSFRAQPISPEEYFNYYLNTFESHFFELMKEEQTETPKKKKKAQEPKTLSDMERWQREFEKRLCEEEEDKR
jgi:predicted RNA-binding protein with PIN domain